MSCLRRWIAAVAALGCRSAARRTWAAMVALGIAASCVVGGSGMAYAQVGTYSYSKEALAKDKKAYELKTYKYAVPSHEVLDPLGEIAQPRYVRQADGSFAAAGAGAASAGAAVGSDGVAEIMLAGDLMCQNRQQEAAKADGTYDFRSSFSRVRSVFQGADLVVGNLETTLCEDASYMSEEARVGGKPNCNAPSTFLDAVKYAGFDLLVTANNHCVDGGVTGIYQTLAHLEQYGFMHVGTRAGTSGAIGETATRGAATSGVATGKAATSGATSRRFVLVKVDGIKVAFLSYSKFFNTKEKNLTAAGRGRLLSAYSKAQAVSDVRAAKAAGAEYVISYIHWGSEYKTKHKQNQARIARELADAGVDYIVGSHPHVLQEYGSVRSRDGRTVPVAYSLGNFVSHMRRDDTRVTAILDIQLKRDAAGKVQLVDNSYVPCLEFERLGDQDYVVVPLVGSVLKGEGETARACKDAEALIRRRLGSELPSQASLPWRSGLSVMGECVEAAVLLAAVGAAAAG